MKELKEFLQIMQSGKDKNIKPPNLVFSVIVGLVVIPTSIALMNRFSGNNFIFFIILLFGFFVPIHFSCTNIKYLRKEKKKGRSVLFGYLKIKPDDMRYLYFPSWLRIITIFFCAIMTMAIVKDINHSWK